MSYYSPAETFMIICMTRERTCQPRDCLKCGWVLEETREALIKRQEEWEKARKEEEQ